MTRIKLKPPSNQSKPRFSVFQVNLAWWIFFFASGLAALAGVGYLIIKLF